MCEIIRLISPTKFFHIVHQFQARLRGMLQVSPEDSVPFTAIKENIDPHHGKRSVEYALRKVFPHIMIVDGYVCNIHILFVYFNFRDIMCHYIHFAIQSF